jgi:rhodanese-related sulfurtransferase
MSAPRLASSILVWASRPKHPYISRQIRALPIAAHRISTPALHRSQFKLYSTPSSTSKIYTFSDIKTLSSAPTPDTILIDTREPAELETTGTIPSSINIPIKSQPDSFFISAEEFEDRFGFDRPEKGTAVVFYCRSGVRSRAAAELARQAGWRNIAEYTGSWLDWEKNGGKREGGRESGK